MRLSGHRPPTTSCEQCHADAWVQRRPSWPAGTLQWLGSGGTFRPTRSVCRVCGAAGGGSGWAMAFTGSPSRWWTLPLRVLRAVVTTVASERRVEPVPLHYLGAGLLGGVAAGLGAGRGRRPSAAVLGAAGGALLCWCGYATTARSAAGLGDRIALAALQEVSPERAGRRRRARDAAQAATASFPVYGPVDGPVEHPWGGHAGRRVGVSAQDDVVTSVLLVHGHPDDPTDAPWLHVTSSSGHEPPERDEDAVADDLRGRVRSEDPTRDEPPQWQHDHLVVDGRSVPARRLEQGAYRSVVAWVDDVHVVVETHDVPMVPALARVGDLARDYA